MRERAKERGESEILLKVFPLCSSVCFWNPAVVLEQVGMTLGIFTDIHTNMQFSYKCEHTDCLNHTHTQHNNPTHSIIMTDKGGGAEWRECWRGGDLKRVLRERQREC